MGNQKFIGAEDIKKKIEKAERAQYKDVTLEELHKDWMKAASIVNRTGKKEDKENSRRAKMKYIEALRKAGLMEK